MKESEKRDYVAKIIKLVEQEKEALTNEGFTPDGKLTALVEKRAICDQAEADQQAAAVAAKNATKYANETLEDSFKSAVNLADAISGVLGKDNEIVKTMRKYRK